MLKIGQVARQSGISVDTLRYYERQGLIPRPTRNSGGYRLYEPRIFDRIDFIKRAQTFGFTLDEIRQLLHLEKANPHACARVLEMIQRKLEDLDHQYREIQRLRSELSVYRDECHQAVSRGDCCPVIEDFIKPRTGRGNNRKQAVTLRSEEE